MKKDDERILAGLNPQQILAVKHKENPLLIFAGAGSGKTRVITHRIAYLINEYGVNPSNIIALTFTNKAAKEMKERLTSLLGDFSKTLWVSTFHSACVRMLRNNLSKCKMPITKDFVIFDSIDQLNIIKKCVADLIEKGFFTQRELDTHNLTPNNIHHRISHSKQAMIHYYDDDKLIKFIHPVEYPYIKEVYQLYQGRITDSNGLDFDDLLLMTIDMFRKYKDALQQYQGRFKYILVDEYQDTNSIQYILLRMLTAIHKNLCVVGDDDQSIYSWRGADIRNIIEFERDFQGTRVIKLEQNYRSTQNILNAASYVIKNNVSRKEKKLWTKRIVGEPVVLSIASDELDEARMVIDEIMKLQSDDGLKYSDMAILYRVNALSRQFEELLNQKRIPYKIFGGIKFYSRKEIKDILAYLRLISNTSDDVSLLRIINLPKRGIGQTTLVKLEKVSQGKGMSIFDFLSDDENLKEFAGRTRKKLQNFVSLIEKLKDKVDEISEDDFIREIAEKSGYFKMLEDEKTVEAQSRLENIYELISSVEQYFDENPESDFNNFLEDVALINDYENEDTSYDGEDYVSLMTFHNAKGLEFKAVFIVAMERNIFPHRKSLDNSKQIEEERRLCYVAMTRAKEKLYLSFANTRNWYGRFATSIPSVFIKEIPNEMLVRRESLNVPSRLTKSYTDKREWKGQSLKKQKNVVDETFLVDLDVGDKIRHKQLGIGVILKMSGYGMDKIATIIFENGQQVDIMLRYGKLKKIN